MKKKLLIIAAIVAALLLGLYIAGNLATKETPPPVTEPPEPPKTQNPQYIGSSVEGRPIQLYSYGGGDTDVLFVGGIHGGYEWNSVLLAYEFIDFIESGSTTIPADLTVHIVPAANPDGLYAITGKNGRFSLSDVDESGPVGTGRFNANDVDLNRNFDCKWQPESTWRGNVVSAGSEAFSEPEAQAIRDLVYEIDPVAAIFWHSQSNAVYASECENGILPETITLMNTYAEAAGYPAVDSFDAYSITGDVEGWLASIGIPAITVELSTHETLEWEKNKRGFDALLQLYSQEL